MEQKQRDRERMEKVNPKPFQRAMLKRVMKYEYPFLGLNEVNTREFLMAEDPYSVGKNDALRARWIEEAKLLYGAFKPSGPAHPISTVSKSLMKEIVDVIKKLLLSDWNDVNFVLGSKSLQILTDSWQQTPTTSLRSNSTLTQLTTYWAYTRT